MSPVSPVFLTTFLWEQAWIGIKFKEGNLIHEDNPNEVRPTNL